MLRFSAVVIACLSLLSLNCFDKIYPTQAGASASQSNITDWPADMPGVVTVYIEPGEMWKNDTAHWPVTIESEGVSGYTRLPVTVHVKDSSSISILFSNHNYFVKSPGDTIEYRDTIASPGMHWKI